MVEEGFGLPADKAAEYLEEKEKVLSNRSLAGDAGVMLPPQQDSGFPWLIPVEPKTVKRYGIEVSVTRQLRSFESMNSSHTIRCMDHKFYASPK